MSIHSGFDIDPEAEKAMNLTIKIIKDIIHSDPLKTQTLPFTVSLGMDNIKGLHKTPLDLVCLIDNGASINHMQHWPMDSETSKTCWKSLRNLTE